MYVANVTHRDVVVSRSARIVSAIAVACYKQPLPLPPPSNRGSSNRGSNTPVGAVGGTAGAAERARAASDRGQQEVEQVQIPLAAVYLTYPHTLPETLLCGVMQQVRRQALRLLQQRQQLSSIGTVLLYA
jgi:hypothetical protein